MDTNTFLGLALIICQTGWGVAAWKASQANRAQIDEHTKQDEGNFIALRALIRQRA